jgi:SAM-dependent methyltransferase
VRCAECGLLGAYPQPDDDELAAIYSAAYYHRFGFFGDAHGACHAMKQAGFDRLLEHAERFVPPASLLDIGCGLGDMLVAATRRGWAATGVEPHSSALEAAMPIVGDVIRQCAFEEFDTEQSFDLVTCTDVLEHLRRPDAALARMGELLRPGGVLLVTTIDVHSLPARVLGRRWFHFERAHLWFFDRTSLQRLAEEAGLHVISCARSRKLYQLDYLLHILSSADMFPTGQHCARLGLRLLPQCLRTRQFVLPEGLLLLAQKPPGTTASR